MVRLFVNVSGEGEGPVGPSSGEEGSTYDWTSVTNHQAQPHPPMMVFLPVAPQQPPANTNRETISKQ